MRQQSRDYLANFLKDHKVGKVLDVGSLSTENGAHLRDILGKYDYTGVDMRKGDNVDIVMNGHDLSKNFGEEFDLVVCFDTFEHDDAWWLTLEEMKKVLKPGGWLFIGAPSRYCPEHNHPNDYWRFMPQSFDVWFKDFTNTETIVDKNGVFEDEIYGWGQKPI